MNEPLRELEEQYFFLRRNFEEIFEACQTEEQRNELRRRFATARRNYWGSINKQFNESSAEVEDLLREMKRAKERIEDALEDLQQISQILGVITAAVQVGSALAALGV